MPRAPQKVRDKATESLVKNRINIVTGCRVQKIRTGLVTDVSGNTYTFDFIFLATGVKPHPVFANSKLPVGPDGGLRVNRYLQSVEFKTIFGGGDCIYFEHAPLDKVGVYAVRQNPILRHNLQAALEGAQ